MKTFLWLALGVLLLCCTTPTTISAQAADAYDVYDAIYDEAGLKMGAHLVAVEPVPPDSRPERGNWYLVDFVQLPNGAAEQYPDCRQTWENDHALCRLADRTGDWHLFRVPNPHRAGGAYDFVAVTPVSDQWHAFDQKQELPPELFTYVPPAVEVLLAQSTGYRELVWWTPCPRRAPCRQLAANR